ncbi:MAG: hypothetical protein WBP70_16560, partial [Terriglobales bacterium]
MRRFAVAVFAGISFLLWLGILTPATAQSQSSTSTESTPAVRKKSASAKTPAKNATAKNATAKSGTTKSAASKKKTAPAASKKKRRRISPRVRRARQAFVASASLRPMAQQLLQDRTPTAYAGVEAYA